MNEKVKAEIIGLLNEIMNYQNWGYFDDSGCPKLGYGQNIESWIGDSHPIHIAEKIRNLIKLSA